ncbi:hypothetical protein CISG_02437 [Coccidioides immitis RMSCC 3703]|uniref:Uncharacterized protein n=1 Tax=Coccidioides immitis RMSCC 3703 TaxID=454286 RepID=A0A0J8RAY5_COCIT|nr:hypothetical protein CISG_02437 [Coccidioides immitis RMSCC 3703]
MSAIKIGDSLKHIQPIIGRLVPLPTVQELHPTLEDAEAFVAEIDIKSANKVVKLLDSKFPRDPSLNLAYLRRFAKREHLPDHLKQPQEENGLSEPTSNRAKTIHVLISPPLPDRAELATLLAPHTTTSTGSILSDAAQPASHSPPPTILSRTQASIKPPAGFYLALARKLAEEAEQSGRGRAVGAVVVDPAILESSLDEPLSAVVAAAGDSRYHDPNQRSPPPAAPNEPTTTNNSDDQPYHPDSEGQPSDHGLMRLSEPAGIVFLFFDWHDRSAVRALVFRRRARGSELTSFDPERGYGLHWSPDFNWRAMGFIFVEEGVEDEDEDGGASDGFGFHA